MSLKYKLFPEKQYKEIIKEVGSYRYFIYDKGEPIPGSLFSRLLNIENYNCVVAGTGSTSSLCNLRFSEGEHVVIPQNEPVIVVRLLRYDEKRGDPHCNADDQIIFPTQKGNILRLPRRDAPDHYIEIAKNANVLSLADAYHLPEQKSGPIDKYKEKGAKLYVDLKPLKK